MVNFEEANRKTRSFWFASPLLGSATKELKCRKELFGESQPRLYRSPLCYSLLPCDRRPFPFSTGKASPDGTFRAEPTGVPLAASLPEPPKAAGAGGSYWTTDMK